jgi:hypothetical protein
MPLRRRTRPVHLLVMTAAIALVSPASGLELIPAQPLAAGVDGLPRVAGNGETVDRINSALKALDDRNLGSAMCGGETVSDDASVSVSVLSDGPEYLSLLISAGGYCEGAAHPWWIEDVVNFDLRSGEQSDLMDLLPQGWRSNADVMDPLRVLYLGAASEYFLQPGKDQLQDCVGPYAKAVREGWLTIELAIDKTQHGLFMVPVGLAYVDSYCANSVVVPVEYLEGAGFDPRFFDAFGRDSETVSP